MNTAIEGAKRLPMKAWPWSSQIPLSLCKQEEYFKGSAALYSCDKFKGYADYNDFTIKWLAECWRVMKKNASIWLMGSFQNIHNLGYLMKNMGFWILNDIIIWSKHNAVPNFRGTRFQNSHEILLWCTKSKTCKYTFNCRTMKFLNGGKQRKSVRNIGMYGRREVKR